MTTSNLTFEEGEGIEVGNHGAHDFLYEEGTPVEDGNISQLVFEAGTGLGGSDLCKTVVPPVEITIAADNYYTVYVNSVDNKVAERTGDSSNWSDNPDTYTGISLNEGKNILGLRNDNERGNEKDFTWDNDATPATNVFSIKDAEGTVFIPEPGDGGWKFRVDGIYQDGSGNPYNADWVDPNFDDSAWVSEYPWPESVGTAGFGNEKWDTGDFYGADPHYCQPESKANMGGDNADNEHGLGFMRVCIRV